jgi:RIO kinase 1
MRASRSLEELIELGIIEEIIRPLQSGKEAQIYLVRCEGEQRVAKIYKEANNRSFRNRVEYTEGRRVRNSRQQRAMEKKSRYGKEELEAAWKIAELEVLYKLHAASVRVPQPYQFIDGILIMELITNADGNPAPRLIDLTFTPEEAQEMLKHLVQDVVKMLCAGIVHGDLSDFNILVEPNGPVIIDFPQACDPAFNRNAKRLLFRDVRNITRFMGRFAPHLNRLKYGPEMWALYEKGELLPDTQLTGHFVEDKRAIDADALLREIQAASQEAAQKEAAQGLSKYAARRAQRFQDIARDIVEPQPLSEQDDRDRSENNSSPKRSRKNRRRRRGNNGSNNQNNRPNRSDESRSHNKQSRRRRGPRRSH